MSFGPHPNSLAATADPAMVAVIRRGRKEADEDLRAMEGWHRAGDMAGREVRDEGYLEWGGEDA